jgi:hypothetical protein
MCNNVNYYQVLDNVDLPGNKIVKICTDNGSWVVNNGEWTDSEIVALADRTGAFDLLYDPEEDIYTLSDGVPIKVKR